MFGDTVPSELPDKWAMSIRQPIGIAGIITPWNFPMAIPCWKMMPALVDRQRRHLQAVERHAALRDAAGRADGRGRLPAGRGQPRHRHRRRGRRRDRRQPGRRRHLVHRELRHRAGDRGEGRPAAQAALARARWQERRRRPRRRGPGPRGRRDPVERLRDDRPALHRLLAGDRRARACVDPLLAAPRGAGAQAPARFGPRRDDRRRAADQRRARSTRWRRTSTSVAARASSSSAVGAPATATWRTATSSSRRSSPASGRWTGSARRRSSGRSCRSSRSPTTPRR